MQYRVGLENYPSRTLAWVLGHPGCFAYGKDEPAAKENLPAAIRSYADWISQNDPQPWLEGQEIEIQVEDVWDVYTINEDYELEENAYEINAWFLHDWKPLTEIEVERGIKLLTWSRAELVKAVQDLSEEEFNRERQGERWSIAGILKHVGSAEWWYLDRLGLAFPRQELAPQPFERLQQVRTTLNAALPTFVSANRVAGIDGEIWSPRKLLRRAVWHELDHVLHIRKLTGAIEGWIYLP